MVIKSLDQQDPLISPGRQTARHVPSPRDWDDDDPRLWVAVPDRPEWVQYNTRTGMWRYVRQPPP